MGNENGGNIDCIPNSEEKYISFSKSIYDNEKKRLFKIRFVDSFKFLSTSLETLTNNLEKQQFKHMKRIFGGNSELTLQRGIIVMST